MLIAALPAVLIREEDYIRTSAGRAGNTIGPAPTNHELSAVIRIGEVDDCFLKAAGFVNGFHASIVPQNIRLVNYIIALFWLLECRLNAALV